MIGSSDICYEWFVCVLSGHLVPIARSLSICFSRSLSSERVQFSFSHELAWPLRPLSATLDSFHFCRKYLQDGTQSTNSAESLDRNQRKVARAVGRSH